MDFDQAVVIAFAVLGAATAVVRLMNAAVVPLRDLAHLTVWKTDDLWVERFAKAAAWLLWFVLMLGRAIAPFAVKNPAKVFPPAPVKVSETKVGP